MSNGGSIYVTVLSLIALPIAIATAIWMFRNNRNGQAILYLGAALVMVVVLVNNLATKPVLSFLISMLAVGLIITGFVFEKKNRMK